MIRRILALILAWLALSSVAGAHTFAVKVEAAFPTVSRSGVQLKMINPATGELVAGAIIDMQVHYGSASRTIRLSESGPGVYETKEQFDQGEYTFTFFDRTLPGEPLKYEQTGVTLPRLVNQDLLVWDWPPSAPPSGPNPLLLALILAPVGLALVGGVFIMVMVSRARSAQQRS